MVEKFAGVYLEEDDIHELKKIALKERKKLKEIHKEIILEYIKIHGDGNPAFTLDQFVGEDAIKYEALAFFRPREVWDEKIFTLKERNQTKIIQEILWQAQTIAAIAKKRLED